MIRSSSLAVLALSFTVITPTVFGGSTLTLNTGSNPGVFGTPYGTLGLDTSNSWEIYRKYNAWVGTPPAVTGAPVAGNNTAAAFGGQALGDFSANSNSGANGQTFMANTTLASPTSNLFYLSDMSYSPTQTTPHSDANGHISFDLRVGFVQSGSALVTALGPDNSGNMDLNSGNRGSNAVFMHMAAANTTATIAGQPGTDWTIGTNNGVYLVGPTSGSDGGSSPQGTAATDVLINSGTVLDATSADAGVAYGGKLEISTSMYLDPAANGNVILQVKAGNNLFTKSFSPTDPVFAGGGFDWQHATPIIFTGKGSWDAYNAYSTGWGVNGDLVANVGTFAPGDANADGKVNVTDFNTVRSNFGGQDKTFSQGDFNQDGKVNVSDFNILRSHFGVPIGGPVSGATLVTATDTAAPGKIDLVVNPTTGDVELVGGTGVSLSSYEIDSNSGALSPANWVHVSGFSTFLTGAKGISEGTLGTGPSLANAILDLGNIFSGPVHDLLFTAFDNGGNEVEGVVSYVAVPEPATFGIITLGVVGMMIRRRNA